MILSLLIHNVYYKDLAVLQNAPMGHSAVLLTCIKIPLFCVLLSGRLRQVSLCVDDT